MMYKILCIVCLFCCGLVTHSSANPVYNYLFNRSDISGNKDIAVNGKTRILKFENREGINTTSIHSAVALSKHTLNSNQGSVSIWFLALEDLSPFPLTDNLTMNNPYIRTYPFLSDCPNPQNMEDARFKLVWDAGWHPNLMAVFARGGYLDFFDIPHRAFVTSSCFDFRKHTWYHLTLTWDYEKDEYGLYVNGILVGKEDQFYRKKFYRDAINKVLYTGHPTLCYSEIKFYDYILNQQEIYTAFWNESTNFDKKLEDELLHIYAGKNRKSFDWKPDENWELSFLSDLKEKSDLENFHLQGNSEKVEVTSRGVLVETIDTAYNREFLENQVYLWTKKTFEGDLYVEYEFNSLREGGLSLLVTQASGISREDFMQDYPLRTSGRMGMIFKEDVRNYHWEYYREMADVRNDVASFAIIKNPFVKPIAFGCLDKQLEKNVWHKVQFLQTGGKLIGAINGIVVLEGEDNGFSNSGAVYDFGRIAIRCMLHTRMLFRNLKIYNKNEIETITFINQ